MGVEVLLGTPVERIDAGAVVLKDGRRIEARTIVWAAGVRASPLAETLGVALARGGRVVVEPDLTLPGHPEVFVVGDLASMPDGRGGLLPQVSQPAIQAGAHAGRTIAARRSGEPPPTFRYHDRGSAATIGRHAAVFEFPRGLRLSGPIGWFAWLGLHLWYLIGFRNRLRVLISWGWEYLTWDRANRIVGADLDDGVSGVGS
jgi:NADH dehydrogenase